MFVLFRYSKKTGKIDTTLTTPAASAMLKLWAVENTTPAKESLVIDCSTGMVIYHTIGRKNNIPEVEDEKRGLDALCIEFGIPFEVIEEYERGELVD